MCVRVWDSARPPTEPMWVLRNANVFPSRRARSTPTSRTARKAAPKHFHLEEDEWFYCLAGEYIVEVGNQRYELKPGDSVLGPRRVPHAFAFVGNTPGRLMVGFTPAGRVEQFFRDLDARGTYFGAATNEDREAARQRYGIVNVGPPLAF